MRNFTMLFLFFLSVGISYGQAKEITGIITDSETGESVISASVIIKNTAIGASTDFDGKFKLSAKEGDVLVITSLGYNNLEVVITAENNLTIQLVQSTALLDEIIIVGYGAQKKVNLTGSVVTIKSEDMVKNSTGNVSSALSGRLAGVTTIQSSGEPGSDISTIRIRGLSSLNSSAPLILVDGIPRALNNINVNDIESITVLKDAAAAAIYGMRASNGVVLVTTKRGKGKTKLNVNVYSGLQTPTRMPNFLDSFNYATLLNEANVNDGVPESYTPEDLQKFRDGSSPDTHPNTDWIGETLANSSAMHSIDISASGSNENNKIKYFTSLGYLYQDALYANNNFDRLNFRTNLDIELNNSISVLTDFSGNLETRNKPGIAASTLFSNIMRTPPTEVNQYSNGGYSSYSLDPKINNVGYNNTQNFDFQSKIALHIKLPFLEGLKLTTQVAYDRATFRNKSFSVPSNYTTFDGVDEFSLSTPSARGESASLSESQSQGYKLVTEAILSYDKVLEKHEFGAKFIYSKTITQDNYINAGISNLLGTSVDFFIAGDAETRSSSNGTSETGILGYAARVNYSYNNKYLLEFNGRYDGSYKFSKGARYGFFPSVSTAWRISEEDFLNNSTVINNLKLRASYGELGSDVGIGGFRYLEFFGFGSAFIDNSSVSQSIGSSGLADANTTWEKAKTYNIGLELGLWNNLFTLEADVYSKRTSDILTTRSLQVPNTFGAILPAENIGVVDNKGIEIVLNHRNKIKELDYYVNFNFGYAKNEIIDIAEPQDIDPLRRLTGRQIQAGSRIGYIAEGLFLTQQEIDDLNASAPEGTYQTQNPKPGDIKYADINGDGVINGDDRTIIGKGNVPEITYGLNLGFNYKQFDFSTLLQGAANFDMYLSQEASWAFFNGGKVFDAHLNRAQIGADGDVINIDASYPRLTLSGNAVNEVTSSYWIVPGDYMRLKNVEIGYTLPEKLTAKLGLDRLRVYLNGRNLATWSKIKNLDPENPNQRGWFYPQQKIMTLGINVTF